MQKLLTGKDGFEGASLSHYKMIKSNEVEFKLFADLEESCDNFIFEEVERKNRQKIRDISQKYMLNENIMVGEEVERQELVGNQVMSNQQLDKNGENL